MELDMDIVEGIVAGNPRFPSAYDDTEPFFIWDEPGKNHTEPDKAFIKRYYDKLRYAAAHADELVNRAFREEFFDFDGLDRTKVKDSDDMRSRLVFDSFTMNAQKGTVNTYLSNSEFMSGHFIEVYWTDDWEVDMYMIC